MNEVEEIANYNVAARKQTLTGIFHGGLIEGIVDELAKIFESLPLKFPSKTGILEEVA